MDGNRIVVMEEVMERWIITVQDVVPSEIRNSDEWNAMLRDLINTWHKWEVEQLEVVKAWMWSVIDECVSLVDDERNACTRQMMQAENNQEFLYLVELANALAELASDIATIKIAAKYYNEATDIAVATVRAIEIIAQIKEWCGFSAIDVWLVYSPYNLHRRLFALSEA